MTNSSNGTRHIKNFALPPDLERGLLHGMMLGVVPRDTVVREELSREGGFVWDALGAFANTPPPYSMKAVVSAMVDVLGHDKAECTSIVKDVVGEKIGAEGAALVDALRNKRMLIGLINAASDQLSTGVMDSAALLAAMEGSTSRHHLIPASEYLANGIPDDPSGLTLPWPSIQKACGGLFGMWALGGEAGTGKSTLALQMAATVADSGQPVLYYDFENGVPVMLNHLGHAYGKHNTHALLQACSRIYFRDGIKTLMDDLSHFKEKTFIIVDSIQKLPTTQEHRRVGLDKWINKFEALKKQGHTVLLLSEKNRSSSGEARQGGFKETSEIEYSVDFGAQLIEVDEGVVEFHVVKNRHRKSKGFISTLLWRNWQYEEERYEAKTQDGKQEKGTRPNEWTDTDEGSVPTTNVRDHA